VRAFVGMLLIAVLAYGALAQSPPPLTAEQDAVIRRVEGMLIAPCCFTNTVAEHRSPISDEVRQEVRAMVARGATETEILDAFVAKYGERILAVPNPQGFNLLAYILPVVALAVGLIVVAGWVRRHRSPRNQPSAPRPSGSRACPLR